ncbi:aldo/keto reductase [Microbacterium sp. GXF0217]
MEFARLGTSGLKVSRVALGCMGFGDGSREPWTLDSEGAAPVFKQALELGINFWDTANIYSFGASEEIVGQAMKQLTQRDMIVLATKLHRPMHSGPGGGGLSRKAILEQLDASLTRLGTDYIDLYQIHRFDDETPVEETMEALHDVVKAGKVRYLGASSMWAWQFAKLQHVAHTNGWTKFISMQSQYNLLAREEEVEMFEVLRDQGVGALPWSPLAGGMVARPWGVGSATRPDRDSNMNFSGYSLWRESSKVIVDAVQSIAEHRGVSMAQVALAWLMKNPTVTAPVVGALKPHHLADAVAALDLALTGEELAALEKPYARRPPTWV